MMDFDSKETIEQRKNMVERQLILRGIKNQQVIKLFACSSPHVCSSFSQRPILPGYSSSHWIRANHFSTLHRALMVELLNPQEGDEVLEIGTGSGYQTAILAELVKMVYSVERIPELIKRAGGILSQLGYRNVVLVEGMEARGCLGFLLR